MWTWFSLLFPFSDQEPHEQLRMVTNRVDTAATRRRMLYIHPCAREARKSHIPTVGGAPLARGAGDLGPAKAEPQPLRVSLSLARATALLGVHLVISLSATVAYRS